MLERDRKTILQGESKPLILELPGYKVPKIKTALLHTLDRARVFVQQAGSMILIFSVILWALATYPRTETPAPIIAMQERAEAMINAGEDKAGGILASEAGNLASQNALASSFAGRIGHFIEPVVRPLGFDWQIGIGVISSFAAREVIVSTLSIVYGIGEDAVGDNPDGLYETLRSAKRSNGTPVFTTATSMSLLIFYVLAMQCFPTQVVTRRETGSWKWAGLQFGYMTVLAYVAALVTFQGLRFFGVA